MSASFFKCKKNQNKEEGQNGFLIIVYMHYILRTNLQWPRNTVTNWPFKVRSSVLQCPGQRLAVQRTVNQLQLSQVTVLWTANSCPGHCINCSTNHYVQYSLGNTLLLPNLSYYLNFCSHGPNKLQLQSTVIW